MKKTINYKVSGEELEKAKEQAFHSLNCSRKVDGFRKGKVPKKIFNQKFPGEIIMEAANNLIDKKYREIIMDTEIRPLIEPKVNIVKLDEKEIEVNFEVVIKPEVELGEYKNLDVKKDKVVVSEEEMNQKINSLLQEYAELIVKEEGKVEAGDTAIIDFEGLKDDVPFEGGAGENYSLEIGSNTFIPGFEEALIGVSKGETKDINVTFPEDYGSEDLAGQDVTFKVSVNEIKTKVIPELNAEFFEDLGMEDVSNEEELKEKIKKELENAKETEAENKYIDELLTKARENMKCEIEDEIIEAEANAMYKNFLESVEDQGLNEDLYLHLTQTTKEDIIEHMKKEAFIRLQNSYLLNAIIEKEKIEISEEEANSKIKEMASKYNMAEEDIINSLGGKDAIIFDLKANKAIDLMKK